MAKNSCHECKWSASAGHVFDPPQAGLVCVYPFPEGPNYALVDPAYAGLCSFFTVRLSEEPPQNSGNLQGGETTIHLKKAGRPRATAAGDLSREGLGVKIRLARERKGLSQDQLAAMLEINQATVAKWETGQLAPRRQTLILLQRLLGPFDGLALRRG